MTDLTYNVPLDGTGRELTNYKEFIKREDLVTNGEELRRRMDYQRLKMRWSIETRRQRILQFVGFQGAEHSTEFPTPINMMRLELMIYMQQLAVQHPQILVEAADQDQMVVAKHWEMATNKVLQKIDLGRQLSAALLDAMFGLGTIMIGAEALPGDNDKSAQLYCPFAKQVDYADLILDMNALDLYSQQFTASRFQIPLRAAMESDYFDAKAKETIWKLRNEKVSSMNVGSFETQSQQIANPDPRFSRIEMQETFVGWNVWLPAFRKNVIIMGDTSNILKVVDYPDDMPDEGPYKFLTLSGIPGHSGVPGNVLPVSPSHTLYQLSESLDRMMNKAIHQGLRMKELTVVEKGSKEDGETVMKAPDGTIVTVNTLEGIKAMKFGGVDPGLYSFIESLRTINSYVAGNTDVIGGLREQAKTATQEEQLARNSTGTIRTMVTEVYDFVQRIGWHVGSYVWTDKSGLADGTPYKDPRLARYKVRATNFSDIPKKGTLVDQNFTVTPFMQRDMTPSDKLQILTQMVAEIAQLGPLVTAGQQSPIDIDKYIELKAKLSNCPELQTIYRATQPPTNSMPGEAQGQQAMMQQAAKPPATQRTYIRKSVPGYNENQAAQTRANLMLGQNVQPKEKNNI